VEATLATHLMTSCGLFLELIEGTRDRVADTMARILAADTHEIITMIHDGEADEPLLSGCTVRVLDLVPHSSLTMRMVHEPIFRLLDTLLEIPHIVTPPHAALCRSLYKARLRAMHQSLEAGSADHIHVDDDLLQSFDCPV
jgi:iron-sulfur cluster repair protein YtfE (RIC family)